MKKFLVLTLLINWFGISHAFADAHDRKREMVQWMYVGLASEFTKMGGQKSCGKLKPLYRQGKKLYHFYGDKGGDLLELSKKKKLSLLEKIMSHYPKMMKEKVEGPLPKTMAENDPVDLKITQYILKQANPGWSIKRFKALEDKNFKEFCDMADACNKKKPFATAKLSDLTEMDENLLLLRLNESVKARAMKIAYMFSDLMDDIEPISDKELDQTFMQECLDVTQDIESNAIYMIRDRIKKYSLYTNQSVYDLEDRFCRGPYQAQCKVFKRIKKKDD